MIYTIYLTGEINYDSVNYILQHIDQANNDEKVDEIELKICSHGGSLRGGFAIYDAIKLSKKPVNTAAYGHCGSVAITILQAGNIRKATKNTTLFIHPSNMSVEQAIPFEEYIRVTDDYKSNHNKFMQLSSSRCGLSAFDFEKYATPSKYMTAQEALEFGENGLIDEILDYS